MKKEAWAMKKAILANIPCLHPKSAAKQADQPKELAWRAEKALPGEGISRYVELEAARPPGER